MSVEKKILAAQKAFEYVEDGMKLGLGTGSTALAPKDRSFVQKVSSRRLSTDSWCTSPTVSGSKPKSKFKFELFSDLL